MAKHEIYFSLPEGSIINADAVFDIYSDDAKLGTLKVSIGSIEWVPVNHSNGHHLSWEKFDELMVENGE